MTAAPDSGTPTAYELRVRGHLDDHWSTWFDLDVTRHDDGTSTLTGPIADQSRLHGVLAKLRDLGVTLLTLRALDADTGDPTGDHGESERHSADEREFSSSGAGRSTRWDAHCASPDTLLCCGDEGHPHR